MIKRALAILILFAIMMVIAYVALKNIQDPEWGARQMHQLSVLGRTAMFRARWIYNHAADMLSSFKK